MSPVLLHSASVRTILHPPSVISFGYPPTKQKQNNPKFPNFQPIVNYFSMIQNETKQGRQSWRDGSAVKGGAEFRSLHLQKSVA